MAIIGITFLNDMARYFGKGTRLPAAMRKFTDLLSEFIEQEDCEEHDHSADLDIHSPIWKYRVLTVIPLFDALAHLWRFGSQLYFGTWHGQMDDVVSPVSWVIVAFIEWIERTNDSLVAVRLSQDMDEATSDRPLPAPYVLSRQSGFDYRSVHLRIQLARYARNGLGNCNNRGRRLRVAHVRWWVFPYRQKASKCYGSVCL